MDENRLYELMKGTELEPWLSVIKEQIKNGLTVEAYGKLPEWRETLTQLPSIKPQTISLDEVAVTAESLPLLTSGEQEKLKETLKQLMPWRKGPYHFHGVDIDTEWRSDFKWDRLKSIIKPLHGKNVLDVGCGNGYHSWRMLGMGAELVIGIDPSPLFVMQFQAVKHLIGDKNIFVLPIGIQDVPDNLQAFDSVFSMGVLYHRRSAIDHLYQLRSCLKPGGELVLETLVIEGDDQQVLVPADRYAQMRNVWFIPSSKAMILWLSRCGFKNIKLVDESYTSQEEQRATEWMQYHSLKDYLDPNDPSKTIEGYPAPLRAIFTAEAP